MSRWVGLVLSMLVLVIIFSPAQTGAQASEPQVLITRVKAGNASTARFIEVYNNTEEAIDVTSWCVYYSPASGINPSSDNRRLCFDTPELHDRLLLPAKAPVLIASTEFAVTGDFVMSGGLGSGDNGHVFIMNGQRDVKDVLGWGTAVDAEGSPFVMSQSNVLKMMERNQSSLGIYVDTDDNSKDFFDLVNIQFSIGHIFEAIDYCLNLDGLQAEVPEGMTRNSSTGMCFEALPVNICSGLVLSEIGANLAEQFIEVRNAAGSSLDLAGCKLMTNRSPTAEYVFGNHTLATGNHLAVLIKDTGLTLTKTTSGTVYLLSSDNTEIDSVSYANLKTDTSWSLFDDGWKQTYLLTRGLANIFQEFLACSEAQERNPETGRCRNITATTSTLVACRPDQERNLETNRCRLINSSSSLVPCRSGQERNPLTNRCRSVAGATSSLVPCGPGQERNPETNRCRRVPDNTPASFALDPTEMPPPDRLGWWLAGSALALSVGYAFWEWRQEFMSLLRRTPTKSA